MARDSTEDGTTLDKAAKPGRSTWLINRVARTGLTSNLELGALLQLWKGVPRGKVLQHGHSPDQQPNGCGCSPVQVVEDVPAAWLSPRSCELRKKS